MRGPGRRGDGDGRAWGDTGGAPVAVRGGGMSKSVAKASRGGIGGGQKRGISTFLFRHSGAIRAFATDLDNLRCRGAAEGPPEGRRGPGGGRGGRPLTPRRALRTRKCSSSRHSRVQNAHLDEEGAGVAVVADRGADPVPEHLRRPGEKGDLYFMLRINSGASVLVDC